MLGVAIILAMLIWGAHLVGGQQAVPASIARLHLTDCMPPCWIGIVPGETTIEQAKARMVAIYGEHDGVQIRDAGFADGYVSSTAMENTIEGDDLYLFVRLNHSTLVDGRNEIVESIDLFGSSDAKSDYGPTVAEVLGAFGPPDGAIVNDVMNLGSEITLKYPGWDVIFYAKSNRVELTEYPHFYFGSRGAQTPSLNYRRWKGFVTLALTRENPN
jgi:hypothetical protein